MLRRELSLLARTPGLWLAAVMQVIILATFIVIWSDGVPVLEGSLLEQFTGVHTSLLALMLPWAGCRGAGMTRGDVARLALTSGRAGWHVMAARWLACSMALWLFAAAGAPLALVAHQVAAGSLMPGAAYALTLGPLSAFCGLVVVACTYGPQRPLSQWTTATLITVAAFVIMPNGRGFPLALLTVTAVGASAVLISADHRLRYLE